MSHHVKIYYGPYETFFTLSHKPQKLKGLIVQLFKLPVLRKEWPYQKKRRKKLINQLLKRDFRVDLIPVDYINYCMLEICGHEVFRCNIKNLLFNSPVEVDQVCQRAIIAAEDARVKLQRARLYFWLFHLIEGQIFTRSQFAPKDYWPYEIKVRETTACTDCVRCCSMLVNWKKK